MLLPLVAAAVLVPLGFIAVARVTRVAMTRLQLEPWQVLLWFGLAEDAVDELAPKRAVDRPSTTSKLRAVKPLWRV